MFCKLQRYFTEGCAVVPCLQKLPGSCFCCIIDTQNGSEELAHAIPVAAAQQDGNDAPVLSNSHGNDIAMQ